MPLMLRFDRFHRDEDGAGPGIVANWCNDDRVTQFMATGREWVKAEDAVRLWGGPHSFLVYVGADWWDQAEAVGVVGLFDWDIHSEKAELRILLGQRHGEGLGTQMVKAILAYGFKQLGLWRIYLGTAAENIAAVRCFHKCGFRNEGLLVDDLKRGGKRFTNVRMAIMREEWHALQQG